MKLKFVLAIYYCVFTSIIPSFANAENVFHPVEKNIQLVNTRWLYTPYVKTKIQNQMIGTKSLVRFVNLGGSYIPVANMTLTANLSDSTKFDISEIKNDWTKKAFPDLKWSVRESEESLTLETYWPKTNRYLNISVQKLKTGYVSIVTLARMGYLKVVYKDLHDVRRSLQSSVQRDNRNVSLRGVFQKLELLIENAFAQVVPTLPPGLAGLLPGSNTGMGGVGGLGTSTVGGVVTPGVTPNTMNLNITGGTTNSMTFIADPSLVTVSNNAATVSNNAVITSGNMVSVGKSAEITSANMAAAAKSGEVISANAANTAGSLDRTSQNGLEATRIMNNLMRDKTNAFEIAAATAAGATVGAMAANIVISGLAAGVDFVWNDLLFDKTNKRIRWEKFKQAREEVEKVENSAIELEKQLDGMAIALTDLQEKEKTQGVDLSYMDLLANLENQQDQLNSEAGALRILATRQSSKAEIEACLARATSLEKTARDVEKAIKFAKDNKITSTNSKTNFFCDQFEALKRKLIATETSLSQLNTSLVAGKNEYFKFREEEIQQMQKDSNYINKENANGGFLESDKDLTDSAVKLAKKEQSKEEDYFIEQCIAGKNDAGQYADEVYQRDLKKSVPYVGSDMTPDSRTSKYFDCKKVYVLTQKEKANNGGVVDIEKVKKHAYEEAEASAKFSNNMHHSINIGRIEADLDENRKWFEKKEVENQCYQLLGQKMSETQESSCNRISPKLMALYRSHKKANDLWVNNCQKSYEAAVLGANASRSDYASVIAKLRVQNQ